jgi:hypothetical protein
MKAATTKDKCLYVTILSFLYMNRTVPSSDHPTQLQFPQYQIADFAISILKFEIVCRV